MNERGTYGSTLLSGDPQEHRGSSLGVWLIGALVAGGAALWAKHQSDQIAKLYATAGLPYQSFSKGLRLRAGELSGAAGNSLQGLARRLGTRKELEHG